MKITLVSKEVNWSNKDGQPYLDSNSRAQARVVITTKEHGSTKLSGFQYQTSPVMSWVVGGEYEIETRTNGKYTNFSLPKQASVAPSRPESRPENSPRTIFTEEDHQMIKAIYNSIFPNGGGIDLSEKNKPY